MKSIPTLFTLLILTCAMTACPDSSQHYPAPPAARPPDPAPKAELEKKIELEQKLREQTEARLQKQEATTSQWQTLTLFAFGGAAVLLIIGTALGAKARHDTKPSQP